MGDTHCQSVASGHTETHQKVVELLGPGDDVQDHADVLCQLRHFPRKSREGLGFTIGKGGGIAT